MNKSFEIIINKNKYFLKCDLTNTPVYLCKVNETNAIFVDEYAEWAYHRIKRERELSKWENSPIT